jgi:hypothetical protein
MLTHIPKSFRSRFPATSGGGLPLLARAEQSRAEQSRAEQSRAVIPLSLLFAWRTVAQTNGSSAIIATDTGATMPHLAEKTVLPSHVLFVLSGNIRFFRHLNLIFIDRGIILKLWVFMHCNLHSPKNSNTVPAGLSREQSII